MSGRKIPKIRIVITLIVFAVWGSLMAVHFREQYFPQTTSTTTTYQQVIKELPTNDFNAKKVSKMNIYYGQNKTRSIGNITSTLSHHPDGYEIDSRVSFEISKKHRVKMDQLGKLFQVPGLDGKDFKAGIETNAIITPNYQLQNLTFRAKTNLFDIACEGEMKLGKMLLSMKQGNNNINREISIPQGTMAFNSFEPVQLPKNLKVGQEFNMRWYDVLTQSYRTATSKVVGEETLRWGRHRVPATVIRTKSGALNSVSWVGADGEIIQYQILSFTFIRETPEQKKEQEMHLAKERQKLLEVSEGKESTVDESPKEEKKVQ